jgi:transcriptional regulator with XRE-family HTH domain
MSIGKRIREARLTSNLSINALAKKVGVSSTAAWNWDNEYTTPRDESIDRIARALSIDPHFLRTGEKKKHEEVEASTNDIASILVDAKSKIAKSLGVAMDSVKLELKINM